MKTHSILSASGLSAGLLCCSLFLSGCQLSQTNLSGDLVSDSDRLVVNTRSFDDQISRTDTVELKNGRFEMSIENPVPVTVFLMSLPGEQEVRRMISRPVRLLLLPGDRLRISGDLEDLKKSGTALYDALNKTKYYDLDSRKEVTGRMLVNAYAEKDPKNTAMLKYLNSKLQEFTKDSETEALSLIRNEPANIASAYATLFLSDEQAVRMYELLDPSVKNGPMKAVLDRVIGQKKTSLAKKTAWENLRKGASAPDFQLKDLEGNIRSLKDFSGKYVVLDFWGTWCGWCMKGMPEMKKYYEKYGSRVEFVGISCRDSEEKWRSGVEKLGLKWTQLFNGKAEEVTTAYGVPGFPTKVVIDPEGRVVAKYAGEDPAFYEELDRLF